jgi:hypothetical protein
MSRMKNAITVHAAILAAVEATKYPPVILYRAIKRKPNVSVVALCHAQQSS